MVFDTGQIIFGLLDLFHHTGSERFLVSARRAAGWLVQVQSSDGCWDKYTWNDIPHTYDARVAWALLELYKITQCSEYKHSAIKQLRWALSQQQSNGWFERSSFARDEEPVLHTIAYTLRGLLESGILLEEIEFIEASKKTADMLLEVCQRDKVLYGYYDRNWDPATRSRCLTGLSQMAIVWLLLYELYSDVAYREQAETTNRYVQRTQILANCPNIYGAVAGSYPVWGRYCAWMFPNWAVKFLIDALVLEERLRAQTEQMQPGQGEWTLANLG
jgi:hypothetical protein